MKTLRLSRYLFSKGFIRELLVVVQLVLMLLYASAVLLPIDAILLRAQALHRTLPLDFSQTLFFNPSGVLLESTIWEMTEEPSTFRITDLVSSMPEVSQVLQITEDSATFEKTIGVDKNGVAMTGRVKTKLITYSQGYDILSQLPCSQGGWSAGDGDACPILVSAALAADLPVGTHTELAIGPDQQTVPCVVTGILEQNVSIPVAKFYASEAELSSISLDTSQPEEEKLILAQFDSQLFQDVTWMPGAILIPSEGTDVGQLQQTLNEAAGNMGSVVSLSQVEFESIQAALSDYTYFLPALLLTLLACFGYGGYLFLHVRQRRTEFAVFYILGMTRRRMIWLNLWSSLVLLLVSFCIAAVLRPWFMQQYLLQMTPGRFGPVSTIFCLVLLLGALLLSLLAGFQQSRRQSVAAQYKGGD